jgi:uncharacterized membrane protein
MKHSTIPLGAESARLNKELDVTILVLGLLLFLGVHSMRIVAEGQRGGLVQRLGANGYKAVYSLVSAAGLALVIWGYALARQEPVPLWAPLLWARHLAALLMLLALVLLAAAYVPGNQIKAAVKHPMVLAVKVWAFAHLLANHTLADVLLFGGFLLWAVLCFRAARARDRAQGTVYRLGRLPMTLVAVAVGTGAWAALAFGLHTWLFGVAPFAVAR